MFTNYYPTKLITHEFLDLGKSLNSSIELHLPSEGYLSRHASKIMSHIEDITLLQGRDQVNAFTGEYRSSDEERDLLDGAIEDAVKAKVKMKALFPAEGEAAEAILADLNATPVDVRVGFSEQSEQVNARLAKLNTPESRARFELLQLLPVLDRYSEVQKEFEALSQKKDAFESAKLRGTVKTHIEGMKERFDFIFTYLRGQMIDVPAKYETAAKEIQESVTRIMAVAEARETRKKNSDD